jgi:hypothetical protein
MFEAGALSKNLDVSRVCPVLFDVDPVDLREPLHQFQACKFDKDGIWHLIKTINSRLGESRLDESLLDRSFDKWWPDLEKDVAEELKRPSVEPRVIARSDRELVEEILELVRVISQGIPARTWPGTRVRSTTLLDLLKIGIESSMLDIEYPSEFYKKDPRGKNRYLVDVRVGDSSTTADLDDVQEAVKSIRQTDVISDVHRNNIESLSLKLYKIGSRIIDGTSGFVGRRT